MTKNRNENIDRIRQYDRERGKLPHRKAATARYLKKFRSDNPKCVAAHSKVARAIKSGRLVRPVKCDKCSTKGKVIGHHHDYNKPLDVIWLCQPCHKQLHRDTF
jgi:predicted SnoaL-like aldol condensation-catalyzing enzyme